MRRLYKFRGSEIDVGSNYPNRNGYYEDQITDRSCTCGNYINGNQVGCWYSTFDGYISNKFIYNGSINTPVINYGDDYIKYYIIINGSNLNKKAIHIEWDYD